MVARCLSLDIAMSVTGWAFQFSHSREPFEYGLIKTNPKLSVSERLAFFRVELIKLLDRFNPTHIVIEDVYTGINPKVAGALFRFAGVAIECCQSIAKVEPYIIHTNTVKSFFKAKKKEEIFDIVVDIFGWEDEGLSFKKFNDVADALAMLLCYCQMLKLEVFRIDKEYGYLYEV